MCEPTTMAILAVSAAAASAYSTYEQGQAEAEQLKAQAETERRAAIDATQRGAAEAGRARSAGTQAVAENKVALAGAGVDVQSGTSLDILAETRALSELDVQTIKNNAQRETWGHQVLAEQYLWGARNAKRQSKIGAAASFLGGAAQAGSMYYGRRK